VTRILLLGGGHAHLVAGPLLAAKLPAGARLSLVAPSRRLLYSGMMPGWLAGQYRFDDCAIDLRRLCESAGIAWIEDTVVDIDFTTRVAIGAAGQYAFDLASVNVGSANRLGDVANAGAGCTVLGAKPFADFVARWEAWRADCVARPGRRSIVVVGGGAAAVEIAFALARLGRDEPAIAGSAVALASTGVALMAGHSGRVAALALRGLREAGVDVRFGHRYRGVEAGAVRFDGQPSLRADLVVVATGALPPDWLAEAAQRHRVAVASDGGIAVRGDLRSTSHAAVFAAGDCATFVDRAVPKSGVHALRQGPVLAANLAAAASVAKGPGGPHDGATGEPVPSVPPASLQTFAPRHPTLALLNRCDGRAIGSWGPLGFEGAWVWRWKDRIDRRFMGRFR
jgi:NADH dehydrogenase FAD-containing subunit